MTRKKTNPKKMSAVELEEKQLDDVSGGIAIIADGTSNTFGTSNTIGEGGFTAYQTGGSSGDVVRLKPSLSSFDKPLDK